MRFSEDVFGPLAETLDSFKMTKKKILFVMSIATVLTMSRTSLFILAVVIVISMIILFIKTTQTLYIKKIYKNSQIKHSSINILKHWNLKRKI